MLDADAAVLTRMENLRRATIYAMRDPAIAHEFLKTMIGRALSTTPTAATWFDAGLRDRGVQAGEAPARTDAAASTGRLGRR